MLTACRNMRCVAPAVEDLFVQISRASRVRDLDLGVDDELDPSSAVSRSQPLLDASSASAGRVVLYFYPRSLVRDDAIDATVERNCNLSRHEHLWRLQINLWPPFAEWSWIPHILSRIVSKHFQAMSVMLYLRMDDTAEDLDGLLTTMEQDDVLARLDSILQEKRFSGTVASRGVCIGIVDHENVWTSGNEVIGMGSVLRERLDRCDELVRRKMPRTHGRGILSTVHHFQAFKSWRVDMNNIHRRRMRAEQKNNTGEDAHPRAKVQGLRRNTY